MRAQLRVGMFAAGVAAMLGLGGCTSGLYDAGQRAQAPAGSELFRRTLVAEYRTLAKTAQDRANWRSANHFSQKAIDAAAGRDVLPDPVVDASLKAETLEEMSRTRERFVQVLAIGGAKRDGELAGQTQGAFDCWLEREENGNWPDQARICRARFLSGLGGLESATPLPAPPPTVTPAAPTARGPWTALFDPKSAEITFEGQLEINKASAALLDNPRTRAQITGHSDLPGSARANMALSQKRALSVADTLELLGVARTRLETRAFGESQPVVKTPKAEPRNRRVEIRVVD